MSQGTRDKRRRRGARQGRQVEQGDPLSLLRALRRRDLPSALRRRVLALGREAVSALVSLIENEPVATHDGSEDPTSYPASHAADLLAQMRAPEAIVPMLDALVRGSAGMGHFFEALTEHLPRFGTALAAPGMKTLLALGNVDPFHEMGGEGAEGVAARAQGTLCHVLIHAGVRDERLVTLLWEYALAWPEMYEDDLVAYGDPALRPKLLSEVQERLSEPLSEASPHERGFDIFPLASAYVRLGGVLAPDTEEQLIALDEQIGAAARARQ